MVDCRLKQNRNLASCKRGNPKKLNCWKKGFDMPSSISYHNPKSSREIQIVKTDYGNRGTFGRKRKEKWSTFKFRNNKPVAILKNVSKEKAIKRANKYMDDNPC